MLRTEGESLATNGLLTTLRSKLRRDSSMPLRVLLTKGMRYLAGLALARLYLVGITKAGRQIRVIGRPRVENFGSIVMGDHVVLRSVNVPVELCSGPEGRLEIGSGVSVNYGTSISAQVRVTIGDRVRIGPYVMIVDSDFHDLYDRSKRPVGRPVVIEDDVWIGAKASVLKGVRIGRGSVVAVGAVVNRDVPPFTIVAGVPAQPVSQLDPERFVPEQLAR